MSGTREVQGALFSHIVSTTGANLTSSLVKWPGKTFDPESPAVTKWYRVTFVPPEQPYRAAVGQEAAVRHTGFLQIDLFYRKTDNGDGAIRTEAEAVAAAFKSGTSLSYSGVYVNITSSAAGKTIEEEAWLHVPVKIWWWADVAN